MTPEQLYGWFPGGQIPTPATSGQFTGGPLSQLAYELANKPRTKPGAGSELPSASYPDDGDATGINPSGVLGDLNSAAGAADKLSGLLGGGSGSGILAGSLSGLGAGAAIPAGAGSLGAGAAASGAAIPAGAGSLGGGGLASIGVSSGPGALSGASAPATGGAGGGVLAGSGLTTALPIAAAAWAVADMLNANGDLDSNQVTQWLGQVGAKRTGYGARAGYLQLPDGRYIQADKKAEAASRAYFNGDPSYTKLYEEWLATARPAGWRP